MWWNEKWEMPADFPEVLKRAGIQRNIRLRYGVYAQHIYKGFYWHSESASLLPSPVWDGCCSHANNLIIFGLLLKMLLVTVHSESLLNDWTWIWRTFKCSNQSYVTFSNLSQSEKEIPVWAILFLSQNMSWMERRQSTKMQIIVESYSRRHHSRVYRRLEEMTSRSSERRWN